MFDGHNDLPVLGAIIRPCQRLDVPIILIVLVFLVLLNPAERNKVDGRMLDGSLVEEFTNLENECQSADNFRESRR